MIKYTELPTTLDDFHDRSCARPFGDGYEPATPEEVDRLIKLAGWSQCDAARVVGVAYEINKGSTTIRKWRAPKYKTDSRQIPYSAWRLMLLKTGVVNLNE